jgi:hypothetical protein
MRWMSVKTGYVDHFSLASLSNSAMSFLSAIKRGRRSALILFDFAGYVAQVA